MNINTITFLWRIAKNKYTGWIAAVLLAALLFYLWKGHRNQVAAMKSQNSAILAHLNDSANELCAEVSKAELKSELLKTRMAALLDSIKIRAGSVKSVKYIKTERLIHDTLTEYVLTELESYQQTFELHEKCLDLSIDMSLKNPVVSMKITNGIYDINHVVRRNLFGLNFAPRWGKKELLQTIVSECGDTIRNNYKIQLKP